MVVASGERPCGLVVWISSFTLTDADEFGLRSLLDRIVERIFLTERFFAHRQKRASPTEETSKDLVRLDLTRPADALLPNKKDKTF